MRRLGIALIAVAMLVASGCAGDPPGDAAQDSASWIVGAWEGEVVDTGMRIVFTAEGDYEWSVIDSGEPVARGTWTAESETSPVDLKQSTGQEFVFSVLPLAIFDGEKLHITAPGDYLIRVLVDPEAPQGNIEALMAELRRHTTVASVDFISAEDALEQLEATADSGSVSSGDDLAAAQIEIELRDWSQQGEFIEWLESEADFKIVAAGDAIQEPGGLAFVRAE